MRRSFSVCLAFGLASSAVAQTTEADHTFARSGQSASMSRMARPSLSSREAPGYVGGGRLIHGDARGPADGTFAYDYVGHGWHPGRVFLGWYNSPDAPRSGPYRTDGPRVFDVFSVRPVRKALNKEPAGAEAKR